MSKPEQTGSLLREYDPDFEAQWDERYKLAVSQMELRDQSQERQTETSPAALEIGGNALSSTVELTAIQQELF